MLWKLRSFSICLLDRIAGPGAARAAGVIPDHAGLIGAIHRYAGYADRYRRGRRGVSDGRRVSVVRVGEGVAGLHTGSENGIQQTGVGRGRGAGVGPAHAGQTWRKALALINGRISNGCGVDGPDRLGRRRLIRHHAGAHVIGNSDGSHNKNNGYDDQQFDKGEATLFSSHSKLTNPQRFVVNAPGQRVVKGISMRRTTLLPQVPFQPFSFQWLRNY